MDNNATAVLILLLRNNNNAISAIETSLNSSVFTNIFILENGEETSGKSIARVTYKNNTRVHFYRSNINLGFCNGINFLATKAKEKFSGTKYLLLLNDDAYLERHTIERLSAPLISGRGGISSPRILSHEKPEIIIDDGARCIPFFFQHRARNYNICINDQPPGKSREVEFAAGTCMMISLELFKELGGFDERFFAYFEDWDLCLRAKSRGYNVIHVPGATAWHVCAGSSGKYSLVYQFLMTRNRFIIARKHLKPYIFFTLFLPYFITSRVLLKSLLLWINGGHSGVKGLFKALLWLFSPASIRNRYWPIDNSIPH